VKDHQVTSLVRPSGQFEHAPGGVGADDEQAIAGVDQAHGIGGGMTDRFVADAMAPR